MIIYLYYVSRYDGRGALGDLKLLEPSSGGFDQRLFLTDAMMSSKLSKCAMKNGINLSTVMTPRNLYTMVNFSIRKTFVESILHNVSVNIT